jgi:hypothetical protein
MYDDLKMPWQVDPPINVFAQESFVRREWNRDGLLEEGKNDFFGGSQEISLAELEQSLGTASMVTRWREAPSDLVGTENDCVRTTMRAIVRAIGDDDRDLSNTKLRVGNATALVLFTRA